ncbi:MAG TPA: Wzz/FepE/Etk N-terminal domain-containing protein [Propionibacteriaceae bacterium]|nr:Wzz/FepE/Etk N-terminal domain-containing protein [Propionibacteriaceae bacterium]
MAADLRNMATRRWGLLVLLTVVGAVVGLAYALIRPPEYTAKAYLAVVAENPGDSSAVSYAQAYARIAGQGDALQTAADASGGSASVQELRRSVLAAASPDAPVIELTGAADSGERAANLVNLVADGLTKTANTHTTDTRVRVALLSAAVPPADPTSPQLPLAVAVGAAAGLLLGGLAFLGRGQRNSTDRPGGPETAEGTWLDPSGPVHSPDGSVIQRLTSWRAREPVKVVTSVVPTVDPPPPEGGDMDVKATQEEEPASGVDVEPAVLPEHSREASDEDVKGDGERTSDVNGGKPKGSTPRKRQRGRVGSTGSSRQDGAD